jgi:ABC-type phosphate/phosphonate transport system permease subunit
MRPNLFASVIALLQDILRQIPEMILARLFTRIAVGKLLCPCFFERVNLESNTEADE